SGPPWSWRPATRCSGSGRSPTWSRVTRLTRLTRVTRLSRVTWLSRVPWLSRVAWLSRVTRLRTGAGRIWPRRIWRTRCERHARRRCRGPSGRPSSAWCRSYPWARRARSPAAACANWPWRPGNRGEGAGDPALVRGAPSDKAAQRGVARGVERKLVTSAPPAPYAWSVYVDHEDRPTADAMEPGIHGV